MRYILTHSCSTHHFLSTLAHSARALQERVQLRQVSKPFQAGMGLPEAYGTHKPEEGAFPHQQTVPEMMRIAFTRCTRCAHYAIHPVHCSLATQTMVASTKVSQRLLCREWVVAKGSRRRLV
jgi:hypothetical protein